MLAVAAASEYMISGGLWPLYLMHAGVNFSASWDISPVDSGIRDEFI